MGYKCREDGIQKTRLLTKSTKTTAIDLLYFQHLYSFY